MANKKNKNRRPAPKATPGAPKKVKGSANKGSVNKGPSKTAAGAGSAAKQQRRDAARRQAEMKRKGSWAVLFAGVVVVLGIVGFSVKNAVDSSNAGVADAEGWELPALYGGDDITLASYSGKPVVLNFFASWCTACEAELPEFRAAVEEFGDDVQFVFIDSQDSDRLGKEMIERHGLEDLTIAKDFGASNAALFRELGGRGMPITAFYGPDGSLQFVSSGAMVDGALVDQLRALEFI